MLPSDGVQANADPLVTEGFGDEWKRFTQDDLDLTQKKRIFDDYFANFPWNELPPGAIGADFGCGSGRWATMLAGHVGHLYCIDASATALEIATQNLTGYANCTFLHNSVGAIDLPDNFLDFAYSLGVLHHLPDTRAGLKSCVTKLKPGAPFLVYLYYKLENRPAWFRCVWVLSDLVRRFVSRLPYFARYLVSQVIAFGAYWPISRLNRLLHRCGISADGLPLAYYRDKALYVMRTDALDRFGTRLEWRFTRREIETMMTEAGLVNVRFNDSAPFWCAVGFKGK